MGVAFWGDAENNGNNNHLLLIMCGGIFQKIDLPDLTDWNRFGKRKWLGTTYKKYPRILQN